MLVSSPKLLGPWAALHVNGVWLLRHSIGAARLPGNLKGVRNSSPQESLSELAKPAFSPRAFKIFCTSNPAAFLPQLLAQQTAIEAYKQTSSRLSPHTALGESPRTPLPCKDRRKAPPQKHFAAHSLRDLHPSLVSACHLHSCLEAVRLGSASRDPGPSGLP